MTKIKEESIERFACFDSLSITNENGKRTVIVDGKEIDLSKIISLKVDLDCNGTRLEVHSIKFKDW